MKNSNELQGVELDAAVAKSLGLPLRFAGAWHQHLADARTNNQGEPELWAPSSKWEQGGPLIERERISLLTVTVNWGSAPPEWIANVIGMPQPAGAGPTALIAAMRALVASRRTEIPDPAKD